MEPTELTLDMIGKFLEADEFTYHLREDGSAIDTGFRGRTGTFRIVIFLRDQPALLGVMARMPEVIPEERRVQGAEAVTRANYGMPMGSFELNMSTGDLGFRAAIPIANATISSEQFRDLLRAILWTVDRYHRAFCRLLYSDDLSPAEVIAEVEMAED